MVSVAPDQRCLKQHELEGGTLVFFRRANWNSKGVSYTFEHSYQYQKLIWRWVANFRSMGAVTKPRSGVHHYQQKPWTRLPVQVNPKLSSRKSELSLDISVRRVWRYSNASSLINWGDFLWKLKSWAKCERASKIVSKLALPVTELTCQRSSSKPRNQNTLYWT